MNTWLGGLVANLAMFGALYFGLLTWLGAI
jgi:hypothetical protein